MEACYVLSFYARTSSCCVNLAFDSAVRSLGRSIVSSDLMCFCFFHNLEVQRNGMWVVTIYVLILRL